MMGMLLPEDEELLWIAEESLLAPLPEGTCTTAAQDTFNETGYYERQADTKIID